MNKPAPAKKPEEHLADALKNGLMAIVTNPKLDTKTKLKRLRALIDAHGDAHEAVTGKRPSAVEECNSRMEEGLRRPRSQSGRSLLESLGRGGNGGDLARRLRGRSGDGKRYLTFLLRDGSGGESLAKKIRSRV